MTVDSEKLGRELIDFDPARLQARDFDTATEMAVALAEGAVAEPILWPAGLEPRPVTPAQAPDPADCLPFADVLIVTWTAAEARTLSILFSVGVPLEKWFEYKSNVAHFIPKVTGARAPFNSRALARYYHSLGLYCPVMLGGKRVLCFKSGLHMDYDGPDVPLVDLWKQIIAETGAKLIITTGTAGGVGANVLLGDVIIAAETVFDCTTQFKDKPFHKQAFATSLLSASPVERLHAAMLRPNADRVLKSSLPSHPDGLPVFLYSGSKVPSPKIVTTDFFAFDNTTNTSHLQELGNACEMGDASLGLAISDMQNPPFWTAIRNASDPQIDGSLSPKEQNAVAGKIYKHFGSFTTAASVLACWAFICEFYSLQAEPAALAAPASAEAAWVTSHALQNSRQRERQLQGTHVLLQIGASTGFSAKDIPVAEVPQATLEALAAYLASIKVHLTAHTISYRLVEFIDESYRTQRFILAQVTCDAAEAFRGSYLFSGADVIVKEEFVSN